MATYRQAGESARKNGVPAERAVLESFRADMPVGELRRGLSDFLDGYGVRSNPGRATLFERCVASVAARGGARDPRGVCAVAGRKKLGQAEMTRRAVAGKKRAARGRKKNSAPGKKRYEVQYLDGGEWRRLGSAVASSPAAAVRSFGQQKRWITIGKPFTEGKKLRAVKANPAEASAAAFEDFHGFEPEKVTVVEQRVHHHKYLAGAGILTGLMVRGIDHETHEITKFGGALLAFNEARNQLFVRGGNQKINLRDFGIDEPHELETLGKVLKLAYDTDKRHLGAEGGKAVYVHEFRTTNENGVSVKIRIKRYPDLIYRVLDEQLEFSGGSYVIRREGIDF